MDTRYTVECRRHFVPGPDDKSIPVTHRTMLIDGEFIVTKRLRVSCTRRKGENRFSVSRWVQTNTILYWDKKTQPVFDWRRVERSMDRDEIVDYLRTYLGLDTENAVEELERAAPINKSRYSAPMVMDQVAALSDEDLAALIERLTK